MKPGSYDIFIYGANGYTGTLIAREAKAKGLKTLLGGRNKGAVEKIANELGFDCEIFGMHELSRLKEVLSKVKVVLHCAGPFINTYKAMVEACIETRTHYLDISGEWEVFEAIAKFNEKAKAAGIVLIPGVGFDVVPTDCVALKLHQLMPTGTEINLGIRSIKGGFSHGTAKTMVEHLHKGNAYRKDGIIVKEGSGKRTRLIDYGKGPRFSVCIPWGDISTAFYSTGVPNIKVFFYASKASIKYMKLGNFFSFLTKRKWIIRFLQKRIEKGPSGPDHKVLESGRSIIVGEIKDKDGNTAGVRFEGPQGYKITYQCAIGIAQRVLSIEGKAGFFSPAQLFGLNLLEDMSDYEFTER